MNTFFLDQFIKMLGNLDSLLLKAQSHADAKKFDANHFVGEKLAVDMLNFTKQIQIACDTAKFCVARLSHTEAPKFEDNEKTLADLRGRIHKTQNYLKTMSEADYSHYRSAKYAPHWMNGEWLDGEAYLYQYAIPNFYFHVTTAYAILRKCGVEIGKGDFLGALPFKK
jgi:hypothetical protein